MERLVRFELMGQEYTFWTDAPESEVADILALINELVEENISASPGPIPVNKVAVLVSLNIAFRYFELRAQFERYKAETDERMAGLARRIDAGLAREKELVDR